MFTFIIGLSAVAIAASVGVVLVRSTQRKQIIRQTLGIPIDDCNTIQSAQCHRALREFDAIEGRIRERSPHLSDTQRRELAVNLVRANGLLPIDFGRTR